MMNAYDKVYLEKARTALGRMLDFAVHDLGYGLEQFYELFLASGDADRFGAGDYTLLVGKSGVELAYDVLDRSGIQVVRVKPNYPVDRSSEYWTGWALAYYQWETGLTFEEINTYIPIQRIADLYHPFHEMDIRQFCDKMNELYRAAKPDTNLKLHRQKADLTQKELADTSGVPLRPQGEAGVAQPADVFVNDAHGVEHVVDQAGVLVEHPLPHHSHRNGAGDHGQVEHAAVEAALEGGHLVHHRAHPQREGGDGGHGHDDQDEGVLQGLEENGVLEHLDILGEAHKGEGFAHAVVQEAGDQAHDHGHHDEQDKENERRQQEEICRQGLLPHQRGVAEGALVIGQGFAAGSGRLGFGSHGKALLY